MGLGSMPTGARVYWHLVVLSGTACGFAVTLLDPIEPGANTLHTLAFIVAAALSGGKKIRLLKRSVDEDDVSMSLGFAVTFAALMHLGATAAVLCGAVSALAGCLFPKRQPLYQLAFNVCLGAVESTLGSLAFLVIGGKALGSDPLSLFVAVCGSAATFFLVNTGGVATIIGLCSRENIARLWRDTFLWTAPSYFAGATVSALGIVVFASKMGFVALFVLPVVAMTYHSFKTFAARAQERQSHLEEMQAGQSRLAELYLATIKSLALAIDAKDQYTHQHIIRVQRYGVAIAQEVGLSGDELDAVDTGALLHDIGKLGVPEYILLKPGKLTEEEFDMVKKHPEIGAAILDPVTFPWPVIPVVKHHHEKWDGTGYPDGLRGEEIPFTARVLALADVYDALTSSRSYRGAWSHEKAIQTIRDGAGTHFDPDLVEPACKAIDRVVREMGAEGCGPLTNVPSEPTKLSEPAAQAARDISKVSTEFWALYEVAQTLSTRLGLQETVEILATKLKLIFPGSTCLFMFLNEAGSRLEAQACVGPLKAVFDGAQSTTPNGLSMGCLSRASSHFGRYDPSDLRTEVEVLPNTSEPHSSLIVPIFHQDEPVGTINLYHEDPEVFGDYEAHLLETIAKRAGMALFNGILNDRSHGQSMTDPLTGLHNVKKLAESISDLVAEAGETKTTFALVNLGLDSFKSINDNFGHHKGDQILRAVAGVIRGSIPASALLARRGGDEFVVVLTGSGPDEARAAAERIVVAVQNFDPELVHDRFGALRLQISYGVSVFPEDGMDCTGLMSSVDADMAARKSERRLGNLVAFPVGGPDTGRPAA